MESVLSTVFPTKDTKNTETTKKTTKEQTTTKQTTTTKVTTTKPAETTTINNVSKSSVIIKQSTYLLNLHETSYIMQNLYSTDINADNNKIISTKIFLKIQ